MQEKNVKWKDHYINLADKYLERAYKRAKTTERIEIRALQKEIKKSFDYCQENLVDNIPF